MAKRSCTLPGCTQPHRARGLCSGHWKQQYGKREQYPIVCVTCEKEHLSARRDGKYCSETCKGIGQRGKPSGNQGTSWTRRQRATNKLYWAAKGTQGKSTWTSGPCAQCGTQFTAVGPGLAARFCSTRCATAKKNRVRRARQRGVERAYYTRMSIFTRDGWRCHICKRTVRKDQQAPHPLAPTLDHLVPLAEGGPDNAANVATAHFMCNSRRGARGGNEQLALIG